MAYCILIWDYVGRWSRLFISRESIAWDSEKKTKINLLINILSMMAYYANISVGIVCHHIRIYVAEQTPTRKEIDQI